MLLKKNQFKKERESKQKQVETDTETTSDRSDHFETDVKEQDQIKDTNTKSEEQDCGEQHEEERQVDLKASKQHSSNLSDVLNLYYETIGELERELSHLKRERKNMKITYINQYLNKGSKLSSEENVKRQELKKKLLTNGDEITEIKQKMNRIREDIIENLGRIKFE